MPNAKIATTDEEASCIIANLVAETDTPCPCAGKQGFRIKGTTPDGRPVEIRFDTSAGVLYIDGLTQEEVDGIRQRRCPQWPLHRTEQET